MGSAAFRLSEAAFGEEGRALGEATAALPGHEWLWREDLRASAGGYLAAKRSRDTLHWELHLLHSPVYQVPVLWFRASDSGGQPARAEELWAEVAAEWREALTDDPWKALSQAAHPLLGQPWFNLHPCQTAALLGELGPAGSGKALLSWLSLFAGFLGFPIPLSLIPKS